MRTIEWREGCVRLIDQTALPDEERYLELNDYHAVAQAIRDMQVRGAPAIGVAAALGLALGAQSATAASEDAFLEELRGVALTMAKARPTAVNPRWAVERVLRRVEGEQGVEAMRVAALDEALRLATEDEEANREMGRNGADLIPDGATILTHCNAGALATVTYGTALGVVRAAVEQGKQVRVLADETRPRLQGARLTAWELSRDGIPVTVIVDGAAGHFLRRGEVDCIVVGADRIAANGDVANKVGTYTLSVLAMENGVPFYVAAPTSTIDLTTPDGSHIPIEERRPLEVTHVRGQRIVPEGVPVANPAFDITPHYYVTAIITERGVIEEPYTDRLSRLVGEAAAAN